MYLEAFLKGGDDINNQLFAESFVKLTTELTKEQQLAIPDEKKLLQAGLDIWENFVGIRKKISDPYCERFFAKGMCFRVELDRMIIQNLFIHLVVINKKKKSLNHIIYLKIFFKIKLLLIKSLQNHFLMLGVI